MTKTDIKLPQKQLKFYHNETQNDYKQHDDFICSRFVSLSVWGRYTGGVGEGGYVPRDLFFQAMPLDLQVMYCNRPIYM